LNRGLEITPTPRVRQVINGLLSLPSEFLGVCVLGNHSSLEFPLLRPRYWRVINILTRWWRREIIRFDFLPAFTSDKFCLENSKKKKKKDQSEI
jgi:hypothetical protein